MATTPNKGLAVQDTGSNSGTWGATLNTGVMGILDNNLGGIVTKSVAGSNITLTSDESQNVVIRLTGAQSADIQVTNPCIGFYFVENLTTNAFAITMTNGVTGVVVPKGRSTVIADTTNGCRIAGTDSFPTGTRMSFQQTTAPTGWTKDVSLDDAAVRIVSGTAGTGGSVGFSAAFSSQTPTGTIGGTTLSASQIPSHTHDVVIPQSSSTGAGAFAFLLAKNNAGSATITSNATGGGQSHNHTFAGNAINLAVKYADFIIAVKN